MYQKDKYKDKDRDKDKGLWCNYAQGAALRIQAQKKGGTRIKKTWCCKNVTTHMCNMLIMQHGGAVLVGSE